MATSARRRGLIGLLLLSLAWAGTLALAGAAAAQTGPNLIDGFVFNDVNGNDVPDPGIDPGLSGVTLTLRDANGAPIATTTTAANGEFGFSNLATAVYLVTETVPPGFTATDVTPGTAATVVDLTTVRIQMGGVDTYAGTVFLNRQTAAPPAGSNVIKGFVFDDLNGNGMRDPGEPWVDGAQVTLQDAAGNAIGTRFTVDFGEFAFSGLPGGTYTVVVAAPPGFVSTAAVAGTGGQVVNASAIRVSTSPGTVSYDGQLFLVRQSAGGPPTVPAPPVVTPPSPLPGPSLQTTADTQTVAPGGILTYTLTVAAGGTGINRGALFDTVPAGTQFLDASAGGALWGDTVVWSFANLAPGTVGSVSFRVRVAGSALPGTAIQDQAQLSLPPQTGALSSNAVTSTVVIPGIPVTLLTAVNETTARPGDILIYRFTYQNVGPITLGAVAIADPLPAGLLFLDADASVQVDVATRTIRFQRGDLAPGTGGTVSLRVQVPANTPTGTTFTNQARVEAPGLPQPIAGDAVTTVVQPASFAGTYKLIVNTANPTSITVDAQNHFTVTTLPAGQPAPACLDAQGALNPDGSFDVIAASGQTRFTGRIDPVSATAIVTVQRTGFAPYTVALPRSADVSSLPDALAGTFTGFATNAAGDGLRVRLSIDAGGNATFDADLIQFFPTRTRCRSGSYQVSPNGQLSFAGRTDGQLQLAGNTLLLIYNYADPDGYASVFQVSLTRQ